MTDDDRAKEKADAEGKARKREALNSLLLAVHGTMFLVAFAWCACRRRG